MMNDPLVKWGEYGTNLAKGIKYFVEVDQNFSFRYFGNIVQALRREVPDPVLRVGKTNQQRTNESFHVRGNVNTEGDSCPSQTY